ncbi:30S ribosomal protein S4 [Candidatus Falkowbacteria bacterium RBG_13_39_14]|uniref:Small ribosomal subunit protein uS4 n=1 Tax=Candidatus Falkowbacteria bacterium RBG_13_39_14 TaxID=1797985 RepID=A0A1F5S8B5_9BACT|nr:MAG: 30S ribosomal protein S4 [Candidatus Falkowbacteria bacterium RBG_13_39_14]
MITKAKCRQCRREGKKLFLKGERCNSGKCAIVKRNYVPGIHGNKGPKKLTEYGAQLREKQQAKRIYGITEAQLKNYYGKAIKKKEDTGAKLLEMLEMRFDNVIYRLGIAKSRKQARQMVKHNFFTLNEKKANIPSMEVKVNDRINIKKNKLSKKLVQNLDNNKDGSDLPSWITFDIKERNGKIVGKPAIKEVNPQFDVKAIVEFYSR